MPRKKQQIKALNLYRASTLAQYIEYTILVLFIVHLRQEQ